MRPGDLTTLANAKDWLGITSTNGDARLARLISAASGYVQRYLSRVIPSNTYAQTLNGNGRTALWMLQAPITSVASLTVDGTVIPAAPPLSPSNVGQDRTGYVFDENRVMLLGYAFNKGYQNVSISYTAGYLVSDEAWTVPAAGPYTVTIVNEPFNGDRGVSYAAGGALTAVSGVPAAGQYAVDPDTATYTFSAADAGKDVLITYSYTPFEIEQATIALLSLRYKERDRIGENSKNLAGEVVAFNTKDMTDEIKTLLQNYTRTWRPS